MEVIPKPPIKGSDVLTELSIEEREKICIEYLNEVLIKNSKIGFTMTPRNYGIVIRVAEKE